MRQPRATLRTLARAGPRVRSVECRKSDALDMISFAYTDESRWSVGHDSSAPEDRVAVLSVEKNEYVTAVVHEQYEQSKAVGVGLTVHTSLGRTFAWEAKGMTTRFDSERTTIRADAAHEIVRLEVDRGILVGATQQQVSDHREVPSAWLAVLSASPKEEEDGRGASTARD